MNDLNSPTTTSKKRFLITGGSQGIGAAMVKAARDAGNEVAFTGRNRDLIADVAEATGSHGLRADVSNPDDNEATIDFALEKLGGIDVLINNAGYGYGAELGAIDMEQMRDMFDTNVFGLVDLTNRAAPLFIQQKSGDIVNIASTSGIKGHARGTSYSGSKWAVRGITQCWQAELRPHGVRVMCVCPSEVQTDFGGRAGRNNPNKLFASDIADAVLATIALKQRVLLPEFPVFATNPWAEE